MELFLVHELRRELQRRGDVVGSDAIFIDDLLTRHSAGEASQDARDGNARAANHRFAVLHRGIDGNAVRHAVIVARRYNNPVNTRSAIWSALAARSYSFSDRIHDVTI